MPEVAQVALAAIGGLIGAQIAVGMNEETLRRVLGILMVLMLFVNDLYMPGVPSWLGHMKADFDGMGPIFGEGEAGKALAGCGAWR